jgi:hypothetical protein
MARCITRESTASDVEKLHVLLCNDPELRVEFEMYKMLMGHWCEKYPDVAHTKSHFNKIKSRLEEDGLL